MGCDFEFGDDFEKCQLLIEEYEDILCRENALKSKDRKNKEINEEKEELKKNIRERLETINNKAIGLSQINKLQQLNQKYQILLTEESKM